ncbi:transposase [Streptomyces sp. NPDC006602]|uniref:transposase n=1 Tax=Streptomyces sp. NPDC006602 TaxID=3364751 RepID=UPI0036BCDBD4
MRDGAVRDKDDTSIVDASNPRRLREGGNRHALAHFITTIPRDPARVRARLAWKTTAAIRPTALIIDDMGLHRPSSRTATHRPMWRGSTAWTGALFERRRGTQAAPTIPGMFALRSGISSPAPSKPNPGTVPPLAASRCSHTRRTAREPEALDTSMVDVSSFWSFPPPN